ncbi:MAG: OmpA family protein, partial [Oligoflexales bacterium]|nr:OmpA family protein [Oligoflexales bacterium]
ALNKDEKLSDAKQKDAAFNKDEKLSDARQNEVALNKDEKLSDAKQKDAALNKDVKEGIVTIAALNAEVRRVAETMVITFPNVSFFDNASTSLKKEGIAVLTRFVEAYLPFAGQNTLNIVGFADRRPVRSGSFRKFRDNLELSTLRAVSALRLIEEKGIPLSRIKLMGHGVKTDLLKDEMPKNQTEELALARKIMLVIEPVGVKS